MQDSPGAAPSIASRTAVRADARRNRAAIIAGARELFARDGLEAPLYEVARAAGVGQGTLYRHFATRDDLVAAIAELQVMRLEDLAREAPDTPDAFLEMLARAARIQDEHQDIRELTRSLPADSPVRRDLRRRAAAVFAGPLCRARQAGLVRADLRADDVPVLLRMLGALGSDGVARRRALEWLIDGVRARPGDGGTC